MKRLCFVASVAALEQAAEAVRVKQADLEPEAETENSLSQLETGCSTF